MTHQRWFQWVGWSLLYTLILWSLWAIAALLSPRADDLTTTIWVWIIAVLAPFGLALIGGLAVEASWWTVVPPFVMGMSLLALTAATWLNPPSAHQAGAAAVLTFLLRPNLRSTLRFSRGRMENLGGP